MARTRTRLAIWAALAFYVGSYVILSLCGRYVPVAGGAMRIWLWSWAPYGFWHDRDWNRPVAWFFVPLLLYDQFVWHTDVDSDDSRATGGSRQSTGKRAQRDDAKKQLERTQQLRQSALRMLGWSSLCCLSGSRSSSPRMWAHARSRKRKWRRPPDDFSPSQQGKLMPFTPIHMGAGMVAKAAAPRHFSLVVFGLTQVALDLEVLWNLLRWDPPLHRFCHTWLGATLLAVALTVAGKPASEAIKRLWNRVAARCRDANLSVSVPTTWTAATMGAFFGAWSHLLLDSLYHPDIEPLMPWSEANPLRGRLNPGTVDLGCVVLGLVGLAWFLWTERGRRSSAKP